MKTYLFGAGAVYDERVLAVLKDNLIFESFCPEIWLSRNLPTLAKYAVGSSYPPSELPAATGKTIRFTYSVVGGKR